jgi:hypothetical protein
MRWKFCWKILHFDHGYVTCLYVPFNLVGDACTEDVAILLVYASFLACCSALCLFEKHMLAFELDSCITNKGEKSPQFSLHSKKEEKGEKCM